MVKIREATAEEIKAKNIDPKIKTWGLYAEDDGKIVGHVFLSKNLDAVFAHDALSESDDPQVGARMYLRAKKKLRQWGAKELLVHVDPDSKSLAFWLSCGFKQIGILLRGEVH